VLNLSRNLTMTLRRPYVPGRVLGRLLALAACCAGWLAAPPARADMPMPETVDFNRDVRPIFSNNCYACHGFDANKRKANLRLDRKEGLFTALKGRMPVVPGKPEQSELYRRITAHDPDERMPEKSFNKSLTDRQVAIVRKWIEQGAQWKGHWAYIKPARPVEPAVDQPGFVRSPVDKFVLAKLKEHNLSPSPEADKVTLIRRLSFDLTGLPPTPEEVQAFSQDKSADAYEKLVERLLASPHFGERMAQYWLDLVRYADTIG
jgi:mono/diheme cytochrome c family protein